MKKLRYIYCILLLGFLLGIKDGRVALWVDDDPQPVQVFPYPVSLLPKADQEALKNGIKIGSSEELRSLLEDYLS